MQLVYKSLYHGAFTILLACLCLSDTVNANVARSLIVQKPTSGQNTVPEANVLVAEVVVKGAEGKLAELIKQTAKIKPGGTTTRSGLQADINAIFATGYFSNVKATPSDAAKGVRVTFEVTVNPVLRRVELSGNTVLPEKVILEAFKEQYGNILNWNTFNDSSAKIIRWYTDNDYILARVIDIPKVSNDGVVKLQVNEGVIKNIRVRFFDADNQDEHSRGKPLIGKTPTAAILKRISLKPGQLFKSSQVTPNLQNVLELGIFTSADISFDASKDDKSYTVFINVIENDLASNSEEFIKFQEQLEAAQANKNRIEEAKVLRKQGHLYASDNKHHDKALGKYQAALKIFQEQKNILGAAQVYNNIGGVYDEKKEYDKAISNYENALKNYQSQQNQLGLAIVNNNLGNTYLNAEKYNKAVEHYEQATQLFAALKEPFWQTLSLSNLAFSYFYSDNKDKAIEYYNQAIVSWKNIKPPRDINKLKVDSNTKASERRTSVGISFATSSTKGTYFLATIKLDEKLSNIFWDNEFWVIGTLFNAANAFQKSGDYQQAIYYFNDAFEKWSRFDKKKFTESLGGSLSEKNSKWLDIFINYLGDIIVTQIDADIQQKEIDSNSNNKFLEFLKQEAPIFINELAKNNNSSVEVKQLIPVFLPVFINLISQTQQANDIDDFKIFEDFTKLLLEYAKKNPEFAQYYKDIEASAQPYLQYFFVNSKISRANALIKEGDIAKKQQALKIYQEKLPALKKFKDEELCFDTILNLIKTQNAIATNPVKGKPKLCLINTGLQQAKTLNSIAKNQLELNSNQSVIETLREAEKLLAANTNKPLPNESQKQKQTLELLTLLTSILQKSNSEILKNIDSIIEPFKKFYLDGQLKETKTTVAETYLLLGRAYLTKKDYQNALKSYNSSLALYKTVDKVIEQGDAILGIASVERQRGNLTQAKTQVERALEIIESERAQSSNQEQQQNENNNDNENKFPEVKPQATNYKSYLDLAKYLESKQNYYDFYIDLLVQLHNQQPKQGYDVLAYQASELSKSRSLRAILNRSINQNSQPESNYVELTKIPALSEIQQQLLDDNTVLLQYSLGEERSYLWAVTKNSIQTYQLPKRSEIDTLSRKFIDLLKSPTYRLGTRGIAVAPGADVAKLPDIANQLSDILLAPVAAKLGNKRLLVVTDGALQYVPFAALPKSSKDKNIKPLLVDHEIIGLPSASLQTLLQRKPKTQKPSKTLALLADPIFSRNDERVTLKNVSSPTNPFNNLSTAPLFNRLPGTRKEASQISTLLPESEKLVKLDSSANYSTATSPEISKYRFIHFATHGVFDSGRPERSGVIFSSVNEKGEMQRSLLSTPDAFKLNLSSDLVVLSACTTALGKEIKGEGLIGITGGLMYAGSKSVVSSLWDVDDAGTAELMSKFYANMLKQKQPPSTALRNAQLYMWNSSEWQAPFYWAAFSIQGITTK
jgi:CHAT domain-containing protein